MLHVKYLVHRNSYRSSWKFSAFLIHHNKIVHLVQTCWYKNAIMRKTHISVWPSASTELSQRHHNLYFIVTSISFTIPVRTSPLSSNVWSVDHVHLNVGNIIPRWLPHLCYTFVSWCQHQSHIVCWRSDHQWSRNLKISTFGTSYLFCWLFCWLIYYSCYFI